MHFSAFFVTSLAFLPHTFAQSNRGSAAETTPDVTCNTEPDNDANQKRSVAGSLYVPMAQKRQMERSLSSSLTKRTGTISYSNCGGSPGTPWTNYGITTKEKVISLAFADAVTMAGATQNIDETNIGFSHYFGGTGTDVQLTHFKAMMLGIINDDTNFSVQFECQNTPDCASGRSAMVTDASAGGPNDVKVIQVCQAFFTSASTRYLLPYGSTPNGPYKTQDQWCAKTEVNGQADVSQQSCQFFATAGTTILHELTHLDALATYAGLTADGDNRHGTLDAQSGCELTGARDFLLAYNAGNTEETSPDYNAESYAAAATEIYWANQCGFSAIQPLP